MNMYAYILRVSIVRLKIENKWLEPMWYFYLKILFKSKYFLSKSVILYNKSLIFYKKCNFIYLPLYNLIDMLEMK